MSNIDVQRVSYERLPLDDLVPAPVNPRRGHVESIRDSLREHGQFAPLLVQKSSSMIMKGNHTFKALRLEGFTVADCTIMDVTDDEAQRILTVDNRTSDKGTYDQAELAAQLDEFAKSAAGFAGTGWNPDEYDDLLAALDAMPVMDTQDTDAGWAYDDETLAKRTAQRQASMGDTALHEVTMYFQPDDFIEYKDITKRMQKHYGGISAVEAVLYALRSATATLGGHGYGADGVDADTFVAAPDGDDTLGEYTE